MYVCFFSTSDVFAGEEALKCAGIECSVVPTPVTDKAYCGVSLHVNKDVSLECLDEYEFETVMG